MNSEMHILSAVVRALFAPSALNSIFTIPMLSGKFPLRTAPGKELNIFAALANEADCSLFIFLLHLFCV